MSDNNRGIYEKFNRINRVDGSSEPGGKHDGCDYFVLDLTHDPFAIPALRAYATACKDEYPMLAADLLAKLSGEMSDTPTRVREAAAYHHTRYREQWAIADLSTARMLERYADLLEHSAGEWVPVAEREPPPSWVGDVCYSDGRVFNGHCFHDGKWCNDTTGATVPTPSFWLDFKLPGEQR